MAETGHEATTAPVQDAGSGDPADGEGGGDEGSEASRLLEAFQTFQQDVGSRFEQLEQRLPQPQQQEEEEPQDEFDPSLYEVDPSGFSDEDFGDDGELTPEAQQRAFAEMVQRAARAEAEKLVNPLIEQRMQEQRDRYADELEERYPQLQDPETQDRMISLTVEAANRLGRPEMARDPQLLEMVYLAEQARERAGQEVPAGSTQGVALERGGSAGPADASEGPDDGERIVSAYNRQHFRLGQTR